MNTITSYSKSHRVCLLLLSHTVNMLHYRFVKNTFGSMSQVPCYLSRCQVSAPAISKQTDVLAAIAGEWICVSAVKGNPWRLSSIRSTSGWRILQRLIVKWSEAEEPGVLIQHFSRSKGTQDKGKWGALNIQYMFTNHWQSLWSWPVPWYMLTRQKLTTYTFFISHAEIANKIRFI